MKTAVIFKTIRLLLLGGLLALLPLVATADGVSNVRSVHGVAKTADRLEAILKKKGVTVFNRVKHSEAAAKVGVELRDTQLIIFGNPKLGSPLMRCAQQVAIDLPLKALIWQDEKDAVWITYNNPGYLKKRHGVKGCDPVFAKMAKILAGVTGKAAAKN